MCLTSHSHIHRTCNPCFPAVLPFTSISVVKKEPDIFLANHPTIQISVIHGEITMLVRVGNGSSREKFGKAAFLILEIPEKELVGSFMITSHSHMISPLKVWLLLWYNLTGTYKYWIHKETKWSWSCSQVLSASSLAFITFWLSKDKCWLIHLLCNSFCQSLVPPARPKANQISRKQFHILKEARL